MIQRIQSVYLLIATILVGITLFAPLAWFGIDSTMYTLHAFGMESEAGEVVQTPIYWVGILLSVATVLPFVTIFLFKKRMLQVRLCFVEGVLLLGSLVMFGIAYFANGGAEAQGLKPTVALPLVAILFVYLAGKAIFKDELLVKSLDRIR